MSALVGVVGAGTMGAGIAQVAAVAGDRVLIVDAVPGAAERAVAGIRERVKAQVAKGRLSLDPDTLDLAAVDSAAGLAPLADCGIVIEAIVEDLAVKRAFFAELEDVVGPDRILASNTSSLSPTALAAGLVHPERLVGLHFFNPVPAMKLVEVISGLATAPEVADAAAELATRWGKTVVRSTATPGFIVNRIARPFYAEAWRLHEEHASVPQAIDSVLTGAGGFRMGPFALMDLIGHDVNEAVTRSVWAAFGYDPRFAPSLAQRALVDAGWLGRKSGRGVYGYGPAAAAAPSTAATPDTSATPATPATPATGSAPPAAVIEHGSEPSPLRPLLDRTGVAVVRGDRDDTALDTAPGLPGGVIELPSGALLVQCDGTTATSLSAAFERPVIVVDRVLDPAKATAIAIAPSDGCPPAALAETVGLLSAADLDVYVIDDTPGMIVTRTVAMLANLAADAVACRVASEADIDTAMRLGVNYPVGPLAWARQWGMGAVLRILDSLENWYRDGHYRASPLLRRAALAELRRALACRGRACSGHQSEDDRRPGVLGEQHLAEQGDDLALRGHRVVDDLDIRARAGGREPAEQGVPHPVHDPGHHGRHPGGGIEFSPGHAALPHHRDGVEPQHLLQDPYLLAVVGDIGGRLGAQRLRAQLKEADEVLAALIPPMVEIAEWHLGWQWDRGIGQGVLSEVKSWRQEWDTLVFGEDAVR
jgi:3-hydroxybutyryl-CoA dehydrogenase